MSRVALIGVITFALGSTVAAERAAKACGLKLTVATPKVNKPIAPSRYPSRVLILGDASSSIGRALKRAGHVVETADSVDEVRKREYQVVLVSDDGELASAENAWNDASVLPLKRGTRSNLASVERSLSRTPLAQAEKRVVLASGPETVENRRIVRSGDTAEEPELVSASDVGSRNVASVSPEERPIEEQRVEETPIEERPVVAQRVEPVRKTKLVEVPVETAKPAKAAKKEQPEEQRDEPKPVLAARAAPVAEPKGEQAKSIRRLDTANGNGANRKKGPDSVQFSLASTRLRDSAKRGLDRHAAYLRAHESATILIEGHTDEVGSEEINLVLAEARVESARKYLTRKGIAESRISTRAFGESNPPYSPPSNPKNRCVFIKTEGE